MQVHIESPLGTKIGSGPITTARNWEYTSKLNGAGRFQFEFSLEDPQADVVAENRYAVCYAEVGGEWQQAGGAGKIDNVETVMNEDGSAFLRASGADILRDLAQRTIGPLKLFDVGWRSPEVVIQHDTWTSSDWGPNRILGDTFDGNEGTSDRTDTFWEEHVMLYVGYTAPVSGVRMIIDVGNTNSWSQGYGYDIMYSNAAGRWTHCTGVTDGTVDADGYPWGQTGTISFDYPPDPGKITHAGYDLYWIRFGPFERQAGPITLAEVYVLGDIPTADGLADVEGVLPDGWSFDTVNGYSATKAECYIRFEYESMLQALRILAEDLGEYFILGAGQQIVWLQDDPKLNPPPSGWHLLPAYGEDMDWSDDTGFVTELSVKEDASDVCSRIYPFGAGSFGDRITLLYTNRTPSAEYTLSKADNYIKHDDNDALHRIDVSRVWPEIDALDDSPNSTNLAANQLFDAALEYLSTHLEPRVSYDARVGGITEALTPGESIDIEYWRYADGERVFYVDDTLVVISSTVRIGEEGFFTVGMEIGEVPEPPSDEASRVVDVITRNKRSAFREAPQLRGVVRVDEHGGTHHQDGDDELDPAQLSGAKGATGSVLMSDGEGAYWSDELVIGSGGAGMGIIDGQLIVSIGQGVLVAGARAEELTMDFGQVMTPGDFVLIRDGTNEEYVAVGSLVSGTTYNVTRNLDGSGADGWPAGTVFLVLGQAGDGRVVIEGGDYPKIQLLEQGNAGYNDVTEQTRVGDLVGITDPLFGVLSGFGIWTENGYFTGSINSASGQIGGWELGDYTFTADSGEVGLNSEVTVGTDWRFWAGDATPGSAPFRVDSDGNLVASSATIEGEVTADSGEIGGWTLSASQLYSTGAWIDAVNKSISLNSQTFGDEGIQLDYNSGQPRLYVGDGVDTYLQFAAGVLELNGAVVSGIAAGSERAIQGWQLTSTFSSSDADTVAWGSGTLTFTNGDNFAITAGNTGNMTAKTYIYWDENVSETALQTSTTAGDAVGAGKVLIAVAEDSTSEANYMLFGGEGSSLINGEDIEADSITASEIAANSITANEIAANTIDTGQIAAGAITADQIEANAVTASKINVTTLSAMSADIGTVTSGRVSLLSSGTIGGGNATGLMIDDNLSYDSDNWHLLTLDAGTWQVGIGTDGALYAGAGDILLDANGLTLITKDNDWARSNTINFMDGSSLIAQIYTYTDPANDWVVSARILNDDLVYANSVARLMARSNDLSGSGEIRLTAESNTQLASIHAVATETGPEAYVALTAEDGVRVSHGLYIGDRFLDTAPPDDCIRVDKAMFMGGGNYNANAMVDGQLVLAEASSDYGFVMADHGLSLTGNAYWAGGSWYAYSAGYPATIGVNGDDGHISFYVDDTLRSTNEGVVFSNVARMTYNDFILNTIPLALKDIAAPASSLGVSKLYSSSGELVGMDEAGNKTTLTPHNFDLIPDGPSELMAWSHYSVRHGKAVNVDMMKLARLVEELTGEKLVYIEEAE